MTTMSEEEIECVICGEKVEYMEVGSSSSFGSSDLDTRPAEMTRSTIDYWVQKCPSCGYCAPNLSECRDNTLEIVKSSSYQNIINDSAMPEVAASFMALSYEDEHYEKFSDAAWNAIHAAWICDDEEDDHSAIRCRKHAVSLINRANGRRQKIANQDGASEAITIDLMRRSGLFKDALTLIAREKEYNGDETIHQIISYQKELVDKKDVGVYLITDALG